MTLEIGSDVDMRDVDFTGMDMTLGYDIANIPGLEVFGKVTTDDEWNMGDIHVGATFSF